MEAVCLLVSIAMIPFSKKINDRMETPATRIISAISSRRNKYNGAYFFLKCILLIDLNTIHVINSEPIMKRKISHPLRESFSCDGAKLKIFRIAGSENMMAVRIIIQCPIKRKSP
jgi:hypothetical protein